MVEVYRVGVTLRLVDEATPALRRLIGALGVANEAAEKLRATLTDLAGTRMAGLSRSMLGVEKRLTGIADAGEQMGATVGASFDRLGIGVGALRTELAGVAAEMKGIAAESRAIRAFSAGVPAVVGAVPDMAPAGFTDGCRSARCTPVSA